MNKTYKYILVIIIVVVLTASCSLKKEINDTDTNSNVNNIETNGDNMEELKNINVIINNNTYSLKLESNETVKDFVKLLPLELKMDELNNNEKYFYLESSLPTNSSVPEKINKGDVYLYGDNCLVIFYKSFNTSYSYTKIGHIGNLPDLGSSSVIVKFEK